MPFCGNGLPNGRRNFGKTPTTVQSRLLRIWKRVRDETLSRGDFIKNYLSRYQKRIRSDLELARAYPKRKLGIVTKNLLDRFESLWQFAHVEGVEPTNNEAERQLRELVIYRKICFFIQSETERRFIETIFSVIATKKYNGVNPLDYIKSCIDSFRLNRPAPRLIPAWCGPIPVVC